MNAFEEMIQPLCDCGLRSVDIETIQVNTGLKCNQQCGHCYLGASPERTEMMDWATMAMILDAAERADCKLIDVTGGAPELNPHLRRFIEAARDRGLDVQVRTNLTVLLEPDLETMPEFYRGHEVKLVASLPCYTAQNVSKQRGEGVFAKSIEVIRRLNAMGYGSGPALQLNLVYNPGGPVLPPEQSALEAEYRRELGGRYGLVFTHLLTITNLPLGRFLADLRRQGRQDEYTRTLREAFNAKTLDGLMCRHQISVRWDGALHDCDFNLALGLSVDHGAPNHISKFDPDVLKTRRIVADVHCFGCTAGAGSSCAGALV